MKENVLWTEETSSVGPATEPHHFIRSSDLQQAWWWQCHAVGLDNNKVQVWVLQENDDTKHRSKATSAL